MNSFRNRYYYYGRSAWLKWVLIFVLALMPVEMILADIPTGCDHDAGAMSMADMPGHDMASMDAIAEKGDCCYCHGACQSGACNKISCGTTHLVPLIIPATIYNSAVTHTLSIDLCTSLHSGLFARSHYRPPRS